mmetsp:Transcript_8478/g.25457  ORF Transcript_8478/g.25457 Transcript_8478/m.25457 type:complete len:239 (-) Transcript_8478:470-1186(-)
MMWAAAAAVRTYPPPSTSVRCRIYPGSAPASHWRMTHHRPAAVAMLPVGAPSGPGLPVSGKCGGALPTSQLTASTRCLEHSLIRMVGRSISPLMILPLSLTQDMSRPLPPPYILPRWHACPGRGKPWPQSCNGYLRPEAGAQQHAQPQLSQVHDCLCPLRILPLPLAGLQTWTRSTSSMLRPPLRAQTTRPTPPPQSRAQPLRNRRSPLPSQISPGQPALEQLYPTAVTLQRQASQTS